VDAVFSWMGGKRRLRYEIVRRLPEHECYCEVFAGAAWVLFAKEPSPVEVLNDIDGELVNLYEAIRNRPVDLARQFRWLPRTRELFGQFKRPTRRRLSRLERASRFLYLIQYSFAGQTRHFGTGATRGAGGREIWRLRRQLLRGRRRLERVVIEHLPFEACIGRYDRPHTVFYLDPPYLGTAGYRFPFGEADHRRLAELLRGIQGRFVLSCNDHPLLRELYAGLRVEQVSVKYSVGQGPMRARPVRELIISGGKGP